jgi:alkanesulfonate monooxygenase SsuD/methylene tetrahydromethanopterin reductase-like flavin-dependent oxidoreductase (luciferase family)
MAVSFNTTPEGHQKTDTMRIGIGLPAAVPAADMTQIGRYAVAAERAGFALAGVIDRLVLAAAAASTSRIHLISTVINVSWRATG